MVRAMAQRKTILIVDDDADLRELLAEQLEARGRVRRHQRGDTARRA